MKFELNIKISGKVSNGEVEIDLGGHDKVEEVLGGDGSEPDDVVLIKQAFEKIRESNSAFVDQLRSVFEPGVSDDGSEGHKPASHPHQGNSAGSSVGGLSPDEVVEGEASFIVYKHGDHFHVKVSGYMDDGSLIHKGEFFYPVKNTYQDIIDREGDIPGYVLSLVALRGLDDALGKEGLSAVDISETGEWEPVSELAGGLSADKFFNMYKMKVKTLL